MARRFELGTNCAPATCHPRFMGFSGFQATNDTLKSRQLWPKLSYDGANPTLDLIVPISPQISAVVC
jgi:hypothetical protein